MKDVLISFAALAPLFVINAIAFDPEHWQFWAFLISGMWASTIAGLRG